MAVHHPIHHLHCHPYTSTIHTRRWSRCQLKRWQMHGRSHLKTNGRRYIESTGVSISFHAIFALKLFFLMHKSKMANFRCRQTEIFVQNQLKLINFVNLGYFWVGAHLCLRLVSLRHHWPPPRGCLDRRATQNTHSICCVNSSNSSSSTSTLPCIEINCTFPHYIFNACLVLLYVQLFAMRRKWKWKRLPLVVLCIFVYVMRDSFGRSSTIMMYVCVVCEYFCLRLTSFAHLILSD